MGRRRQYSRDADAVVRSYEHKGRVVNIRVTTQGVFYAELFDQRIEGGSLKTLIEKLKRAIASAGDIRIPVTDYRQDYDEAPEFIDLTLTGVGRGGRSICVNEDNETVAVWGQLFRRLTPEEKAEFAQALQAVRAAEQRREALIESFQINPAEAIEKAAAAIDASGKGEDDAV